MIENIGIDIIENERFKDFINNETKLKHILSPIEIEKLNSFTAYSRKLEFIASRFAAKEALFKAGIKDPFPSISILNHEDGSPYVVCSSNKKILITLSHNKSSSIAMVVIE